MNIPKLFVKLQYLENIEIKGINRFGKRYKVGRRGYGKSSIFKYLILQKISNCSDRDLEEISTIDHSTFSKARKRFDNESIFGKFFLYLVKSMIREKIILSEKVLIDSSFVRTYSSRKEEGSSFLTKNKKKLGNGFKLHALTDEKGNPLVLIITKGSRNDMPIAIPLLKDFEKLNIKVNYVLADKGYDFEDIIVYIFKSLNAKAAIPIKDKTGRKTKTNRTNYQGYQDFKYKAKGRCLKKSIYNRRSAIERFFSTLKNKYNLGKERTRGVGSFTRNCYLSCICYLLEKLYLHNINIF